MAGTSASFTGPQYYNDCMGPLWFGPFAEDLARRLPERPSGDLLEIACGTGILTGRLRERLPASLQVVATDISKPMLDYARAKLADRGGIEWQEANAMQLPFPDARFGVVACGFGFMFMPDWQEALRQARRMLAKGGVLLFSVWDRIEQNAHARANATVLQSLFPGEPEMWFTAPYEMHAPDLLRRLLDAAGFGDARIDVKRIPVQADPRNIAIGQIRGTPRSLLIEQRGVSLDLVIDKVTAALAEVGGNPYRGTAQAVMVEARAA